MCRALLVAFVAILGCARPAAPPSSPLPPPAPTSSPRDGDEQAAYALDAACDAIEVAQTKAKALAPVAGGDAARALREVADGLDAAGETLSDHIEPPPASKPFSDAERKDAAQAAVDALGELRDAGDILDGLAQNAPKEHEKPLEAIRAAVTEAEDSVEEAIEALGAKTPDER